MPQVIEQSLFLFFQTISWTFVRRTKWRTRWGPHWLGGRREGRGGKRVRPRRIRPPGASCQGIKEHYHEQKIIIIYTLIICQKILYRESGHCLAGFYRFYFDGARCVRFTYGGCGGNANNFATEEECRSACQGQVQRWAIQ